MPVYFTDLSFSLLYSYINDLLQMHVIFRYAERDSAVVKKYGSNARANTENMAYTRGDSRTLEPMPEISFRLGSRVDSVRFNVTKIQSFSL